MQGIGAETDGPQSNEPVMANLRQNPPPVVQLEISSDGFAVTQNSVKFLPNGIQVSLELPPCIECKARNESLASAQNLDQKH